MAGLAAQIAPLRGEIAKAVEGVVTSQRFIGGPEVEALEAAIAGLCRREFAIACGSGSDALLLSLQAAGIGPGDDVLCPAFTFFATAGAVARLGARPVFIDVDPATLDVGPEQAEAGWAVSERPRAILPVDLFGRVAPIAALSEWAGARELALVEDAAQALGARDAEGRPSGSRGLAGCFSFFPSKNLGGFGDGGLVATDDADMAERLRALRDHGRGVDGRHHMVGTNSRLDALQAAVLRVKLAHLDGWTRQRREHAEDYDRRFAALGARPGAAVAADRPLATPPVAPAPAVHGYNQYVVRVHAPRRDALRADLARAGIETRVYYERGLHREPCFAGLPAAPLPVTEAACGETLALPVHPALSPSDCEYVVDRVHRFLFA